MFKLDTLVELLAELIRVMVVDGLSERVRKLAGSLKLRRQPRGMAAIRRHVHRRARAKLLARLSTKP